MARDYKLVEHVSESAPKDSWLGILQHWFRAVSVVLRAGKTFESLPVASGCIGPEMAFRKRPSLILLNWIEATSQT